MEIAIFYALENKFGYNKAERLETKYTNFIRRAIKENISLADDIVNEISRLEK